MIIVMKKIILISLLLFSFNGWTESYEECMDRAFNPDITKDRPSRNTVINECRKINAEESEKKRQLEAEKKRQLEAEKKQKEAEERIQLRIKQKPNWYRWSQNERALGREV